jgi:RimJ/RimL family protein N-acetyltransferase
VNHGMSRSACVDSLPVLANGAVRLREVHLGDSAALVALFARPEVAAHLSPPPASVGEFNSWIALSQSRRSERRAACYTLLNGNSEALGLFMALRLETDGHAEIGFAIAPELWGTGVFATAAEIYLKFLFDEWDITTLMGRTLERNGRGVGAMRKLGATVIERADRNGELELIWTVTKDEYEQRRGTGATPLSG